VGILLRIIVRFNFGCLSIVTFNLSNGILLYMGLFILLGAVTKRAQLPFSAWLPAAMAAPTPVSALVHSSTLVTAGVYLLVRFNQFYERGVLSILLIYVSILTIFISGVGANFEIDIKKIIALSTLSQLGVMIIILSIGNYNLAYFHLIVHAIFKAILFLCAGVVIHGRGGSQDIRGIGSTLDIFPLTRIIILLSRFSLLGFPFLSGFYSKDIVLEIMYLLNNNYLLILIIIFSTRLTVIYSLRIIYYICIKSIFDTAIFYKENINLIETPLLLIGLFVIFLGGALSWLVFPCPIFINILFSIKVLNLGLILFGLLLVLGFIYFMDRVGFIKQSYFLGKI